MGLFSSIKNFFLGTKPEQKRVSRFTEEQEGVYNTLLRQGADETNSDALEERYKKLFEEELLPGIAQQFTTSGGQRTGAFRSALGRAGSDLSSQLAAMRSGRGMQKLGMGLAPRFDVQNTPGGPGGLQAIAAPIAEAIGMMYGMPGMGKLVKKQSLAGKLAGRGGGQITSGGGNQFQKDEEGYMEGQPHGFSSADLNPAMMKRLFGMLHS